jgi:hypothetical protein
LVKSGWAMRSPLLVETRLFHIAGLAVLIPLALLLCLLPAATDAYWMWEMADPRSAVLVGAAYAGAAVYFLFALRGDDWPQAQGAVEGIGVVAAALLLPVAMHWDMVRPYHPMTLSWLAAYYVGLLGAPLVVRLQGERGGHGASEDGQLVPAVRAWILVRGCLYLGLGIALFVFADAFASAWPWPIFSVEVRLFAGQVGSFAWPTVSILRGYTTWRRHRLPLLLVGSQGLVQFGGVFLAGTPYAWSSPVGILLPLVFAEWLLTGAFLFVWHERRTLGARIHATT